jgi:amidase
MKPTREEIVAIAGEGHLHVDDGLLDDLMSIIDEVMVAIADVEPLLPTRPEASPERSAGRRPEGDEDPLNAIMRWCHVPPTGEGLLSGRRLAVKDSMAIAGVPMTCGFRGLEGFVPERDSVVVARALAAGAEIVAVTNMDCLGVAGSGETSNYGPTLNPHDPSRTAGGSSSGAAAALAYAGIDLTLGGDQGGSVRSPASWCGVLGIKPTHSLVPYSGVIGIDASVDHVGPLARNVADLASLLEAIAGADDSDPRQYDVDRRGYVAAAQGAGDLRGLRIGVLSEGFSEGTDEEAATAAAVRAAIDRLATLGAEVTEVSVPTHQQVTGIAFATYLEGMASLLRSGGSGHGWRGRYAPDLTLALGRALERASDDLSVQAKVIWIAGNYLTKRYHGALYAVAQNARPAIVAAYDEAFADVDVIAMPTTPFPAFEPSAENDLPNFVRRGWSMLGNTTPFNVTGHPAISLPTSMVDGLPVGTMLVAPRFADDVLIRIAAAYEARHGWTPLPSVEALVPS